MQKQEIFDKVATHLFTQGKQAMNGEACQYRAEDGTMCAVGCLIPDEIYSPAIENRSWDDFQYASDPEMKKVYSALGSGKNLKLLDRLQSVHDEAPNWESEKTMKNALASVAKIHHLDASILEGLHFEDGYQYAN
jgi:hypothetical protein